MMLDLASAGNTARSVPIHGRRFIANIYFVLGIFGLAFFCAIRYYYICSAGMAELADALASGASDRKVVQVQVLFPAPTRASEEYLRGFFIRIGA